MNITQKRLKQIIREELEVILTDEEATEFFGDDIEQHLQEINQVDQGIEKKMAAAQKSSPLVALKRAISKKTGTSKVEAVIHIIKSLLEDDEGALDLLVRNISLLKKGLGQEEQPEDLSQEEQPEEPV